MRKYRIVILLLIICVFSLCKKNNTTELTPPSSIDTHGPQSNQPTSYLDSILYVDIVDTTIKSVFSYTMVSGQAGIMPYPLPTDTNLTCALDLDNDQIMDISLNCRTQYYLCSGLGNQPQLFCSIGLIGNTADSSIWNAFAPGYGCLDSIHSGYIIGQNSFFWPNGGTIRGGGCGVLYSFNKNRDFYIGIKLHRNNTIMFGWLLVNYGDDNSITLKSYAINRRHNNDIYAGQTQ